MLLDNNASVTSRKNNRAGGYEVQPTTASQRSLHNAPIFRLLLKVAVNGTHQCDFLNFCGPVKVQHASRDVGVDSGSM